MTDILWGTDVKVVDPSASPVYVGPGYGQVFTVDFPASRFCKVFFAGTEDPAWNTKRLTGGLDPLPQTVAPQVCFDHWASDGAMVTWLNAFLDAMPAYLHSGPLVPELGISMALTHLQEPENHGLGVTASEFKRRYGVLYPAVKAHQYGHLVAVVPVQTRQWSSGSGAGDVSTWWVGDDRCDFPGMDTYGDGWRADYLTPDALLLYPLALQALSANRLWIPEFGCKLINDPDGSKRGAWITACTKAMVQSNAIIQCSWWDVVRSDGDFRLTDQPSFNAWSGVFAHGGADLGRHLFGDSVADVTVTADTVSTTDNVVVLAAGATVTLWNAQSGGSQITDITDDSAGTSTITALVTSDGTDGRIPGQITPFYGPDTSPETYFLYASANGGPRQLITANADIAAAAAGLQDLLNALSAHTSNTNNPHQTSLTNLADTNLTAPTSRVQGETVGWDIPSQRYVSTSALLAAGAVLLAPPPTGSTWNPNTVNLPSGGVWANQGGSGDPWFVTTLPYSAADTNPDFWQVKSTGPSGGLVKTSWNNGNGEGRDAPSSNSRKARVVYELAEGSGGPSTGIFFAASTNPTSAGSRENLFAAYGTGHSTKPGWVEATRTISALLGVQAGSGAYNSVAAACFRGRRSTSGAPGSGTWITGDWIIDSLGVPYLCTAGGTPGAWVGGGAGVSYGAFTDVTSFGASTGHGATHFQYRTEPGSVARLVGQLAFSGAITANTTVATLPLVPAIAPAKFTIRFNGTGASTQEWTLDSSGHLSCAAALANTDTCNWDDVTYVHV